MLGAQETESSSAPHHAKRTLLLTLLALPSWIAVSRIEAVPEPLSLMPGPSCTPSRWAPIMTTLLGSPVLVSAVMLKVWRVSIDLSRTNFTVTGPLAILASRDWPVACVTPVAGAVAGSTPPRVPLRAPAALL